MQDPEFFRELEVRRTRAIVAGDVAEIERLHAADYQLVTPAGRAYSRAQYLELIDGGAFYASWEHGPIAVRATAGMAVVRYQARIALRSGRTVECWHTDVYELRGDSWLAVWSQATETLKPPP